jgi:hypothetical protein
MLTALEEAGRFSKKECRKLRLFAVACARTYHGEGTPKNEILDIFKNAERAADHQEPLLVPEDFVWAENWLLMDSPRAAWRWITLMEEEGQGIVPCRLLREVFGNPFLDAEPHYSLPNLVFQWTRSKQADHAARGGMVRLLAEAAYKKRDRRGRLDPLRLAVLADACEEEGCQNEALLAHLRGLEPCEGATRWAPLQEAHYRGCWALDVVLGWL